jgi:hypothetical protein
MWLMVYRVGHQNTSPRKPIDLEYPQSGLSRTQNVTAAMIYQTVSHGDEPSATSSKADGELDYISNSWVRRNARPSTTHQNFQIRLLDILAIGIKASK